MSDIRDLAEEMFLELKQIQSLLNVLYDSYFMYNDKDNKIQEYLMKSYSKYGDLTIITLKLVEKEVKNVNKMIELLFAK